MKVVSKEKANIAAIVLAAGRGSRMGSTVGTPKVLRKVGNKTMLSHVLDSLTQTSLHNFCLVLSKNYKVFEPFLSNYRHTNVCIQATANGTAGAVAAASVSFENQPVCSYSSQELLRGKPFKNNRYVLICNGDTPAISPSLLENFIDFSLKNSFKLNIIGMNLPNPSGYGRLVLENKKLVRIVEEKDASESVKKISLCNSGIFFAETNFLFSLLQEVRDNNEQNEYYLTDCIKLATNKNENVGVFTTDKWHTLLGVNTPEQLNDLLLHMNT
ncbi:MAG: hypothetical protein CMP11_07305 [Zetaproteobacteria bacterium]|nr:hypothetical protein [Pseudobdellovibrionaceae bacterium]|tara:strand:- start:2849 stop:3661 length:813 start_codon:yes stop_codon:yes gene_type:complete